MAASQQEIIEFLCEEVELIARSCLGRVHNRNRLDQEDENYASLNDLLDKWSSKKLPELPQ